MIEAGKMDRPATIQTPTDSVSSLGEPILTFATYKLRFVSLNALSGGEAIAAMANESTVTHKIRMHYCDGLVPKMRIIISGRTFEINSVIEIGRREMHEVSATEVLDE